MSWNLPVTLNPKVAPTDDALPGPTPASVELASIPEHPGILLKTGPSTHSGHRFDAFGRCPQYWAYRYHLNVIPRTNRSKDGTLNARGLGTLGHTGLAHYYQRLQAIQLGNDPEQYLPVEAAIYARAVQGDQEEGPGCSAWRNAVPQVWETVRTYVEFYADTRRERLNVLGVEAEIDFSNLYGFPFTRSVDLAGVEDGLVYVYDHKFVGRIQTSTFMRYAIDGQFLDLQHAGRRLYGDRWGGAKLNLIQWPQAGQVQFHRDLIPAAPAAVAARPDMVRRTKAEMDFLAVTGVSLWDHPKRLSETVCLTPYGLCEGVDLCRMGPAPGVRALNPGRLPVLS